MVDLLEQTPLLNFGNPSIRALVRGRGWQDLPPRARIGAVYDFVRDEIRFGYNADDAIRASKVLADGYGQCNTKGILLMALLRAVQIPCRLHGFTIAKSLQRGVVPEAVYGLAPENIVHSWVEVFLDGEWIILEGFIVDKPMLEALQTRLGAGPLCGYGVGVECLEAPPVEWDGRDTFVQSTGINHDFGVFDTPDDFFKEHAQALGGLRGFLYRHPFIAFDEIPDIKSIT